jgi:hypothetical protein
METLSLTGLSYERLPYRDVLMRALFSKVQSGALRRTRQAEPFSSLLFFSQPRPSDQIPLIEDPLGSFIDVEQLSYYVWLQADKSAAYRKKTLYLFLAESQDEMLAIRSDAYAQYARSSRLAVRAPRSGT